MTQAKHTPDDGFFDGGWAWMAHPSYNDGNPIPVKMLVVDGVRWYHPLDPNSATEFEWDRRDDAWQMVLTPKQAMLADAATELLEALQGLVAVSDSLPCTWANARAVGKARAAIAKAEGQS